MKLAVLGRPRLFLLSAALAFGCAQVVTAPVPPVARPPALPTFVAPAIAAGPLGRGAILWLPGAEQLVSYYDNMLELRDTVSGTVLVQRLADTPNSWKDGIQWAAVSPSGTRLAVAFHRHVELRELPSLTVLWSAAIFPSAMGFSTDGQQLRVTEGAATVAFSVADGQRVTPAEVAVAKRWQDSYALNADDTLAFERQASQLTVWDPKKDVALRSFELPKDTSAAPVWVGPYLGVRDAKEYLLIDARKPERRFPLTGAGSLDRVELSTDGTRLRSSKEGELLEWRLGRATPTVLASGVPQRAWLGPAGVRAESSYTSLTVWRQNASGARVAQRALGRVSWVEFGPAGEVVASDATQARLLVLNPSGAPQELAFPAGEQPQLAAFEPIGGRFVVAAGRKLRMYQQPKLELQQTVELPFEPEALAWRSEPAELLIADTENLYSVALGSGKVTPFSDVLGVRRVVASPDGKSVALVALRDSKLALTVLSKAGSEHQPLGDDLLDLRFSPDSKTLWALHKDALLSLRLPLSTSATEQAERKSVKANGYDARLSPTGKVYCMTQRLRIAADNGELLLEPEPLTVQPTWSAQGLTLTSAERQSAPTVVALPAGTTGLPPTPKNPAKARAMPELPLFSGGVEAWALNRDGSVLATLGSSGTVDTFSTKGGLRTRLAESAGALIGSEDASHLLVVARDARSLTLWDTQTWQAQVEWPVAEGISQVAVSHDGTRVAVLDDKGALQLVFADRSLRRYALRPDMGVRGLAFDPSGQYLVLGGLPLRLLRLADEAVVYGYAASVETDGPAIVAWVSEGGAYLGDRRALPGAATFAQQPTPNLLQTFLGVPAP